MKLVFLNVGAGSCSALVWPDGGAWLFDCGKKTGVSLDNTLRGIGVAAVERLYVQNLDEDHIAGLPDIIGPGGAMAGGANIYWNRNMDVFEVGNVKRRKNRYTTRAWNEWEGLVRSLIRGVPKPRWNAEARCYSPSRNLDPGSTNNASMVVVLETTRDQKHKVVLPGDMEENGWVDLLESRGNDYLPRDMANCDVFVAGHHGRENGYNKEVIEYVKPSVVVISDGPITYGTQEGMTSKYGQHARGLTIGGRVRKVLTTRKDGDITMEWRGPHGTPVWRTEH